MRHPLLELTHLILLRKRLSGRKRKNVIGRRFFVPMPDGSKVPVYYYRPTEPPASPMPVIFNLHGGAWVFGDALGVDVQSQSLAESFGATVMNIDYTPLDAKPFPRPQEETLAVVKYVLGRAAVYHIDPERVNLIGYSAGGHIAAGAAFLLRDAGIKVERQILCYPFLDFVGFDYAGYMGVKGERAVKFEKGARAFFFDTLPDDAPMLSPAHAAPENLRGLAPALIIGCGEDDPLLPQAEAYAEKLRAANVPVGLRVYEKARHGFMEVNFPDGHESSAKNEEQRELMIEAFSYIKETAFPAPGGFGVASSPRR